MASVVVKEEIIEEILPAPAYSEKMGSNEVVVKIEAAEETTGKKFECEPCGLSFLTIELFDKHKTDPSCKGLTCPLCGYGEMFTDLEERYRKVASHMETCIPSKLRVIKIRTFRLR